MSAITSVLGVHGRGRQPLAETVAQMLRERELLLVLDSFEHLLGAATGASRRRDRYVSRSSASSRDL